MPSTYLTVPFKQKDAAKSLGARWDREAGQWYAPEGLDLGAFAEWLPKSRAPGTVATAATATSESTALEPASRGIPLSRLLQGVAKVVAGAYSAGVWTTAEVLRATTRDGHVYLELSERDADGRVLAKTQAAIWARTAERIVPEFERATGAMLGAGIKLLIRARPVFKPQHGFSLEIDGIDPTYTLGELEAKKREIRERLKADAVFDLNRRLPPPWDFQAVLVVAPQGAAGLGDFEKEASRLERLAICRFVYMHSRFQGEGAAAEILDALRGGLASFAAGQPPDAAMVIRGGGAVNDLAWLNDYRLARFICECPTPVLTGIGHERDSTILDEVAHQRFDTPSKAVAGIEQLIARRTREAAKAFETIISQSSRDVQSARTTVDRLDRDVEASATSTILDARARSSHLLANLRLDSVRSIHQGSAGARELFSEIRRGSTQTLTDAKNRVPLAMSAIRAEAFAAVRTTKVQIHATVPALLDRAQAAAQRAGNTADGNFRNVVDGSSQAIRNAANGAQALIREIAGQGPTKTLGRGFAIVRDQARKTITSAARAASVESIEIAFNDGTVEAGVRPRQPRSNEYPDSLENKGGKDGTEDFS